MNKLSPQNSQLRTAQVLQRQCVISNTRNIATGSFGSCYVLVGHDPKTKYSFIAHIDIGTYLEGIRTIFSELKRLNVDLNDLMGLRLLGGWKSEPSCLLGQKIISILKEEGIGEKVNFTFFQQKLSGSIDVPGNKATHFPGIHLDAQTGTLSILKNTWISLEQKQYESHLKLVQGLFQEAGLDLSAMTTEERCKAVKNFPVTKQFPLEITVYSKNQS